jgi:RNA polymerase sigma-70 factor (ECF subfamily)
MDTPSPTLLTRLRTLAHPADWDLFVALFGPLLAHWARDLIDTGRVDDVVQDALAIVLCKLPEFHGEDDAGMLAWLRAVVHNRCRELKRQAAARPETGPAEALNGIAAKDELAEILDAEERGVLVRRAIEIMQTDFEPTTWRSCWDTIALDRPIPEVARELGVSVAVVYSARHRVLRRLRSELGGTWE